MRFHLQGRGEISSSSNQERAQPKVGPRGDAKGQDGRVRGELEMGDESGREW